MKKLILCIAAALTFSVLADAQISIKKSDVGQPKMMTTLSMSWSWIYQLDGSYFLEMKSDNQFDDSYWLKIGDDKEQCLESITAIQEMMDDMGESDRYEVDNGMGESFSVTSAKELGVKKLVFHGKHYAGEGYLIASNLNKAYRWIEKNLE